MYHSSLHPIPSFGCSEFRGGVGRTLLGVPLVGGCLEVGAKHVGV